MLAHCERDLFVQAPLFNAGEWMACALSHLLIPHRAQKCVFLRCPAATLGLKGRNMAVPSMKFDSLNGSTKPGGQVSIAHCAQERLLFDGSKGRGRAIGLRWYSQMRSPKTHSIDSAIENPCGLLIWDRSKNFDLGINPIRSAPAGNGTVKGQAALTHTKNGSVKAPRQRVIWLSAKQSILFGRPCALPPSSRPLHFSEGRRLVTQAFDCDFIGGSHGLSRFYANPLQSASQKLSAFRLCGKKAVFASDSGAVPAIVMEPAG